MSVAVVPGYYLVCYNAPARQTGSTTAVVPGYYLVCYNRIVQERLAKERCSSRLLLGML